MGLLDDAIRDHLDLKRRRGADPAEIERAEREALGPVRREPIASEDGLSADDLGGGLPDDEAVPTGREGTSPAAEHYGGDLDEADLADGEDWDDYEDDEYELGEEEEGARAEPGRPGLGAEASASAPHNPEPHTERPLAPRPADDDLEATRAHELEPAEEPPGDGEDVLEETPDFLQDTPDHDRLWFEQRPPRDFDFEE